MSKLYATIFSSIALFWGVSAKAVQAFGVIADLEMQSRQGEEQKPKTGYLNFLTLEQNWTEKNSKVVAQVRIFEFYKKSEKTESMLHEVFPAEFNYEYNSSRNRWTIGYQSLFLSEGFNLIDTEIMHARNANISIFSSVEKLYYTSPGISYKNIGDMASFQVAILRFERTDQLSIIQKQLLTKSLPFVTNIEKHSGASEFDTMMRFLGSTSVVDWSAYISRTYEKRINLQLNPLTGQLAQISPTFTSYGFGLTSPIGTAMLRLDYQKNVQRTYIDTNQKLVLIDQNNINFSYDQSFGSNWRAAFVIGATQIGIPKGIEVQTREKEITDAFINLNYKISEQTNMDVSAFERLNADTQGTALAFNTKASANIELRYGIDHFWAGKRSRLTFLDQEDRIYLGVKATVF